MEFTISYSSKTFDGIISAGVMSVDADSIEAVEEAAFDIVMKHYLDNEDDNDRPWYENLKNLSVSVSKPQ